MCGLLALDFGFQRFCCECHVIPLLRSLSVLIYILPIGFAQVGKIENCRDELT
jgi:hypothetical protein